MSWSTYMTCVPPTPAGSYTPASLCEVCSRNCAARFSAASFISSLLPNCRQPVGQALMQAGSNPAPTRSEHKVHLKTFFVDGLSLGMLNGHPVTQYSHPMQCSSLKSTIPLAYCTIAPSAGQDARHPGSAQCMHWSLRISQLNVPS